MKKLFLLSLLYFVLHPLSAQDQDISIFSSPQISINPANTGTFGNSNLRVFAAYDWSSLSGFLDNKQISLSVDKTIVKGMLGVGGNLSYEFGDDLYQSKGAMLSTAYNRGFLNEKYTFSVGIQGGIMQKSFDWDKILFSDLLSGPLGGIYMDTLGSPTYHILYSDFNLGVLVFSNPDKSKIQPWIGVSVSHLFKPNVSFLSISSPLPRKLTIHSGIYIPVSENIVLTPLMLYTTQDHFNVLDLGFVAKYHINRFSASLGGIYNNSQYDQAKEQRISLLAELGYIGFEIRVELKVIDLNTFSQLDYSRGAIGLTWNLHERKN